MDAVGCLRKRALPECLDNLSSTWSGKVTCTRGTIRSVGRNIKSIRSNSNRGQVISIRVLGNQVQQCTVDWIQQNPMNSNNPKSG